MRVIRGIKDLNIKGPTVVTIGIFDGVHRGHQEILKELKKYSRIIKGKSCVITFEPHPLKVLMPKESPPSVISTAHKMRLLEAKGVDIAVIINFTKDFAQSPPLKFADKVLKRRLNTKLLLVGENFVLGKNRSGDVRHLKNIGRRLGFDVRSLKPLKSGTRIISSTLIRRLIMSGRLAEAKKILGRSVTVLGTVVKGEKRGREIGFPTANIDPHHEAMPPSGVYIVKAEFGGRSYQGVVNIGFRPTFHPHKKYAEPVIELHIFDFDKAIYGRDIEITFLKKVRNEKKFRDKHKLAGRVKRDMALAKRYFKNVGA
ncbi:MAG: bifunctional riboflavin kinase/FAD synthetase [Candidatus Omnitrophica bacterium]|nr:bifunctional riboflavin kinase/FAD synthetase [Candidatus Omnitrophota bacterium]MBU4488580.1 bifunctional riboflavin kinase/FAD synthetase [Candidatus Omnitrophota bacterium]MCG2704460.1 bifunctional riboflavin kinase/FAD synthetase [Candidatus Omnitrophota bacterium]